ncbi:MAG: histidinol-phosphatase [Microbacteriaceae bacterium]
MRLDDDLALARTLAAHADLISMRRFTAQDFTVTTKPDRTPVTEADREVEKAIREGIAAARPHDAILGEEFGSTGEQSGEGRPHRQWIVDPIDGTANFLRGVPIWGTLIALAIDGVPQVGVVSAPALGQRWWAATGHGAYRQRTGHHEEPIHVSKVSAISDAVVSYNSLPGWIGAGRGEQAIALATQSWRARAIGDMWAYMLVAEGAIDIATECDLQPYDMAALIPIVTEAGGRFTDIDGNDGPWNGTACATNGLLHADVLAVLK